MPRTCTAPTTSSHGRRWRRSWTGRSSPRRRSAALAAFLISLTTLIPVPALGHEDDLYVFTGSGWGHSIGLSQYGAFGQALDGASAEEIIQYYYGGAAVSSLEDLVAEGKIDASHPLVADADPVWVGIRQSLTTVEFTPVGGPVEVCQVVEESETCVSVGWSEELGSETWAVTSIETEEAAGCLLDRADPAPGEGEAPPIGLGDCTLDLSWGAGGQASRVAIDGETCAATNAGRECFARGTLHLRGEGVAGGFHLLSQLSMNEYLYGLGEMPSSWPSEALEAQAIAGRSYAARRILLHEDPELSTGGDPGLSSSRKASCWCHLYSTSYDQNYVGYAKESNSEYGADWLAAVDATSGEVVSHPEAAWSVVLAFYHSSSGGHTETNATVWGTTALPYLLPVPDPWSNLPEVGNPFTEWTVTASAADLAGLLGWEDVTHVTMVNEAPGTHFEFRGTRDGEAVTVEHVSGWLYSQLGTRSPHFDAVAVERDLPFVDMDDSAHTDGILAIWEAGISNGCGDYYYCPDDVVTRAQMATFLLRALDLEPIDEGPFADVAYTGLHQGSINAVAAAGISLGCEDGAFCPDDIVTRAEMATFLARALGLAPVWEGPFADIDGVGGHQASINAVAAAGISNGCGIDVYCPEDSVTRAQMASFLARAFLWVDELPGPAE